MSRALSAVTRAANRRATTDHDYRAAIREAREAGHTLDEIAGAAGLTRQGVWYLLNPDPRKDRAT